GVDVDEVPARQRVLRIERGGDIDDRGGAEAGEAELLLARPAKCDRLFGALRESGGFDRGFAGVFAAKSAAEIRYDHPDALLGDVKSAGQFAADSERILRRRP